MDLKRLTHGLIYAALMACTMAGCSSEDAMGMDDGGSARWIRGLDGTLQLSTCTAPDISRPPPWCQCVGESGPVCTLRACDPNEPAVFFFDFNLPGTPTQDETWACDEGGRLFRSACLPDSPTIPCSDVTFPPQLDWRDP